MQIGELFVFLGIKGDDSKIREFDKGISGLAARIDTLKISAIAASYAIYKMVDGAMNFGNTLYNVGEQTGENLQNLQKWSAAAHAANPALSIDQITQSIQGLDNSLVNIKRFGQGNLQPFALFNINAGEMENAIDVLDALRSRMNMYDPATTANLLQQMGLPAGLMSAFKLSDEEWQKFTQNATTTDAAINKLREASQAVAMLDNKWQAFKTNLVSQFAPEIEGAIDSIANAFDFLPEHLDNVFKSFKDLSEWMENFPNVVNAIKIALAGLALAIAPITTIIVGLITLLDKYQAYKKGDDNFFKALLGDSSDAPAIERDQNTRPLSLSDIHSVGGMSKAQRKTIINNTTINNDMQFQGATTKDTAEHGVNYLEKNMKAYRNFLKQDDINSSFTDQQGLGSDY